MLYTQDSYTNPLGWKKLCFLTNGYEIIEYVKYVFTK